MIIPQKRENFTLIQALRGIAAMWVVLFHASEGGHVSALEQALPPQLVFAVFHAGHFGVAIFFALSGFVISYGLTGANITTSFFGRFILRRSIRLDPTYWVSIAIAVTLLALSQIAKHEPLTLPSPISLLSHLFYLQVILNQAEINAVYWTLTYEVQFYLFLVGSLVIKTLIADRVSAQAGKLIDVFLFALAMSSALGLFDGAWPGIFAPLWGCFYIGVLADKARGTTWPRVGFAILSVTLLLNGAFPAISALTAILIAFGVALGWATTGLNWRWLQFLGALSYSLYLIHNPVTGAVSFVVRSVIGDGPAAAAINLLAIIAASVLTAYMLWRLVEHPTHRLARAVPVSGAIYSTMRERLGRGERPV